MSNSFNMNHLDTRFSIENLLRNSNIPNKFHELFLKIDVNTIRVHFNIFDRFIV